MYGPIPILAHDQDVTFVVFGLPRNAASTDVSFVGGIVFVYLSQEYKQGRTVMAVSHHILLLITT